ncbi:LysR family transcriptional regulator [Aureibacter tunicatorum]|uniref:DNA-binding transcriptional LysR family regulator n=1 Tax=Aureibacter tunicatorum TaxID=866807 RepID=A0AAE4BTS9_9BACT|nr:LysR family transcriptional regulator [Aureibacter tunicatorum]MDR6240280.1 DNA-binding transcriptional LysR family regulator [Aureibacter tunicatorum]BDD05839.1 LysR family transcriptional regulator [Aureibacter tunicatorum]
MVNLEWYRTFKAVYEQGTLTAAAQALFISQPGVSLHLSSLEAYVGGKLFDRVSKKMVPTEKGKLLYNALLTPLVELEQVEECFKRTTESDMPTVTIGMCFETFQHSLEKHLHSFDFNLVSRFSDYNTLLRELENGIVDIITTPQKAESKGIVQEVFSQEKIVLIGSNDIDGMEFSNVEKMKDEELLIEWLLKYKWYGASSDNEHFTRFWRANFKRNPNFRQNFIVPNFNSIIRSLGYGSGLAIVPDFLCRSSVEKGKIQILWEGWKTVVNPLYFGYRKKTIYRDQIQQIMQVLKSDL